MSSEREQHGLMAHESQLKEQRLGEEEVLETARIPCASFHVPVFKCEL
jgi:hypothetical protein